MVLFLLVEVHPQFLDVELLDALLQSLLLLQELLVFEVFIVVVADALSLLDQVVDSRL